MRKRIVLPAALVLVVLTCLLRPSWAAGQDIERMLSAMTLEEKVGQMMLVFFKGSELTPQLETMITTHRVGGLILYASSGNTQDAAQTARLCAAAQAKAATTPQGVGLFVGIDQEGGPVVRLRQGVTVFPSQMAVAATGNRDHARTMARILAQELKALGINMNFAPVADVNSNPKNPIISIRSFGSDPALVSRMTAAMTAEYVQARVLCTPKHFPGHGDTSIDSHLGLPTNAHDAKTLEKVDFAPFRAAFAAQAPAVMTAHMETPALDPTPGLPATLSTRILEGTLRKHMRFDGLIVTDSLGMGALDKTFGTVQASLLAAKAGADVLLFGADIGHEPDEQIAAISRLVAAVKSGELPQTRVDDAVRRILAAKKAYGLLDAKAIPDLSAEASVLSGGPDNLQAARAIAQDSMTLVKDVRKLLPLTAKDNTLIIWPKRSEHAPETALSSLPGARLITLPSQPSADQIRQTAQAAAKSGKVVALTYDAARNPAQQAMIRALLAVKPQDVIHVALGAPYDIALFPDAPAAILGHVRRRSRFAGSAGQGPGRQHPPAGKAACRPSMIVSASRRADIPAHYARWLLHRVRAGYAVVPNPFNARQLRHVSLHARDVLALVFWTRDPRPLVPHLSELDDLGLKYYFNFTLLDYPAALHPAGLTVSQALQAFAALAERIGPERVLWRYDPVVLSQQTPPAFHRERFTTLCRALRGLTKRVTVSLMEPYRKTRKRLLQAGVDLLAPSDADLDDMFACMACEAQANGMTPSSCACDYDLARWGFEAAACVDAALLNRLFSAGLSANKDPHQRQTCLCAPSVDIGMYDALPGRLRVLLRHQELHPVRRQQAQTRPAFTLFAWMARCAKALPPRMAHESARQVRISQQAPVDVLSI